MLSQQSDKNANDNNLPQSKGIPKPKASVIISRGSADNDKKRTMISRGVILVLMGAALLALVPMLKMFMVPILLATSFASLFFPFYAKILKLFKGNRGIASSISCFILVFGIIVPVYIVGYLVTRQILVLYGEIGPTVQAFISGGEHSGIFSRIAGNPIFVKLTQLDINWQGSIIDMLKTAGAYLAQMLNKTSLGILGIIIELFITLFIMFYFFMDGERITKKLRRLLPLRLAYQDMIIERFLLVSRATVKGTVVIAFVQGALGTAVLLIFGVKTWLVWGVIMTGLSFIPMMGPGIVLIPFAIIHLATGHVWQGIVILALSFGVVSTVDNMLRPGLVGRGAHMHDLLIFFSTVGGLVTFGPVGLIMGPVIMAFFVSITEIYAMELKEHLG